ncbi:MAG: hypothetical protein V3V75_06680 [Thermoguttaceae bacterium]
MQSKRQQASEDLYIEADRTVRFFNDMFEALGPQPALQVILHDLAAACTRYREAFVTNPESTHTSPGPALLPLKPREPRLLP